LVDLGQVRKGAIVDVDVPSPSLNRHILANTGDKLWTVGNVKAPTACSIASDFDRIYFGGSDPMSKGPLFAMHSGAMGDLTPKKNEIFAHCDWLETRAGPGMASSVSSHFGIAIQFRPG
jgi:hypothetical protein